MTKALSTESKLDPCHLWVMGLTTSGQSSLRVVDRGRPVDVVTIRLEEVLEEAPHLRASVVEQVLPVFIVHVELDHFLAESPGRWTSSQPRSRAIDQN